MFCYDYCTNYVSQCAYTAGVPTTSTWKPKKLAWVNVNKFYDYMSSNVYSGSNYTKIRYMKFW
ncbi:amidase domain-containing protein [Clostridium sp. ZBS13]|uniref:amidase domain-containing protein n=1 Tax=Clostridium sp. ZBS13 TaxID=2949971 RepID=UPI0033900CF9